MNVPKFPVVSPDVTALDALERVYQARASGVVMVTDTHARLIHAEEIVRALDRGGQIQHVPKFEPVNVQVVHPDGQQTTIDSPSPMAMFSIDSGTEQASLLVQLGNMQDYITPFSLSRCGNPIDPHFYPPRDRSTLSDRNMCFCGFAIG